jgi:hypothetical protein
MDGGVHNQRPKQELKKLEELLGMELPEDVELEVLVRDQSKVHKRVLRIKSLGPQAYDIWNADLSGE